MLLGRRRLMPCRTVLQIADLEEKLELAASCKDADLQDERLKAYQVSSVTKYISRCFNS